MADTVAEEAAKRIKPDLNHIKSANRCDCLGYCVAKRLALIQADIWASKDLAGEIYELDKVPEALVRDQGKCK